MRLKIDTACKMKLLQHVSQQLLICRIINNYNRMTMKTIVSGFLISAALAGCINKQENKPEPVKGDSTHRQMIQPDSAVQPRYFWEAVPDGESNRITINKIPGAENDSLTPEYMIGRLNRKYTDLKMSFIKLSGDTLFVRISPGRILTQEMGTTGADIYMTEATLNLCEINHVNYVNFNFRGGDHASPGTYSPKDFMDGH